MKKNHNPNTEKIKNAFRLMPKDEISKHILNDRAVCIAKYQIEDNQKNQDGRYIRFRLGKEFYGISYEAAKEIMDNISLSILPHAPNYIGGVINRRGVLLTVIDLKIFLNIPVNTQEKYQYVIVIEQEDMTVGILADNIEGSETYNLLSLDKPLPTDNIIQTQYILGIHKGITAIANVAAIMTDIQSKLKNNI